MSTTRFERELSDVLPAIRALLDASRVVGRSPGPEALRELARTLEIEIALEDDVSDRDLAFEIALGDAIESRMQSLIWTLGKRANVSFDYARDRVNRALGF